MALKTVYKGADEEYEATIYTDETKTTAFDLTNANGVLVWLYDNNRTLIKKYATNTISGYSDDIEIVAPATQGKVRFRTLAADVEDKKGGVLTADIQVENPNTNFNANVQNLKVSGNVAILSEVYNNGADATP